MKAKTVFVTALLLAVVSSGAALAGKGPGEGGAGMGSQHRSMQGDSSRGQGKTEEHRSDNALQHDRDRERYQGPDTARDKQKAKAKQFGK